MYDNLTRTELEFAYREAEKRIAELEDERSDLDMIAKNYAIKIANLKKSCDETQELLNKQIETTYKLDKENAELKHESRAKENCRNCAYFKEKKYQACIDIKKNKTIRCAFYKWEGEK